MTEFGGIFPTFQLPTGEGSSLAQQIMVALNKDMHLVECNQLL